MVSDRLDIGARRRLVADSCLHRTDLHRTDLHRTDLHRTDLHRTDLHRTDLRSGEVFVRDLALPIRQVLRIKHDVIAMQWTKRTDGQ
uniref:pentapeptide repeat-containing protein n=1 Tax=Rubripirellula reticaptiva TaxID=2528013 RepID=UPI0011B7E236